MSSQVNQGARGARQRKLRNYWLNPQYQAKYIFWLTATGILLVALQLTVFYTFVRENYAILVDLSPMTPEAKAQLYKELWQILGYLGGGSAVFLLIVGLVGLVFSHRTVGPLYHFKRVFREVSEGNRKARVRLRPNDDFQDVAAAFNTMMDELEKRN